MAELPLQETQDTIQIPLISNDHRLDYTSAFRFGPYYLNLIPELNDDKYTYSRQKSHQLSKRQGFSAINNLDWFTGVVNNAADITILDVIPITAIYDVFVAAVFDSSNNTIYIIQIRPQSNSKLLIGSFTSTPAITANDYCFLTEITQASGGNALPAVAVSYTNSLEGLGKAYYAITSAGVFTAASLTQITDVNFPANQTPALITIGRFVFMNGTSYISSLDGRIWNSNATFNDVSTWSNSTGQIGSIGVSSYPDQLIGIERYKHLIVAFGRNTMEFFADVGGLDATSASPLARTDQAFIKFGCKSPRMIKNANDTLFWFSYGDIQSTGLWMLDGYTPVKLSTPYIDSLAVSAWNNDWDHPYQNIQACLINNKPHVLISGINASHVLDGAISWPTGTNGVADTNPIHTADFFGANVACFNIQDQTWWFMNARGTDFHSRMYPIFATEFTGLPSPGNYTQLVLFNADPVAGGSGADKGVYNLRVDGVYRDDVFGGGSGASIMTIAQLAEQSFGNEKRKKLSKLKFNLDNPGYSGVNHYSIYLMYQRDNIQQLAILSPGYPVNAILRSISFPNPQFRHYINNLGMGRLWSFILVEKSDLKIVYKSLEVDAQQGTS